MRGSYELGDPDETGGEGAPGPSSERRWRDRGLDRLTHRVLSLSTRPHRVWSSGSAVRRRPGCCSSTPPTPGPRWHGGGLGAAGRGQPLARLGLHLAAGRRPVRPADRRRPGRLVRHRAARVVPGHRSRGADRPVRRRHRRAQRRLLPSAGDGPPGRRPRARAGRRLRHPAAADARWPARTVTARASPSPGTRPRTSTGAAHPYELPTPTHSYLFLDAAVHGVGSRACGIDVLPQHALWPGAHRFDVIFTDPTT